MTDNKIPQEVLGRKPIDQLTLMQIVMGMKPGQCIKLSREDLIRCAEGNLRSLLFDSVRQSDIDEFLSQISDNWDVSVFKDLIHQTATLTKKPLGA